MSDTTIEKRTATAGLAKAALVGLFTVGSLAACTATDKSAEHRCSASGCNQKHEANSCDSKDSCKDQASCKGSDSCKH